MSRARAWLLAARPPTLWAAVAPVLVGSGLAAADDAFRLDALVAAIIGAIAIQVGVNFANDAADAARGADTEERLGPPRAVASGLLTARQVWRGVAAVFAVATVAGLYLAWISSWIILVIGVASLLAAVGYTSGPAYGYRGLGEVFVFAFFGLAATVGSRYVHDATAPLDAWLLAVPVGLLAVAILVANNIRDIPTDRVAGKRTLAVRMGDRLSRAFYVVLLAACFLLIAVYALLGAAPGGTAIALGAAPLAVVPVRVVSSDATGPALIAALKGTAWLQLAVGVLLAVGATI